MCSSATYGHSLESLLPRLQLRMERDSALEEVSRNVDDLTNLEEQLAAAKAQLQVIWGCAHKAWHARGMSARVWFMLRSGEDGYD